MKQKKLEKATFGAGCFWQVEEAFRKIPGVVSASVGFMGGWKKNPSYILVCSGLTGHAEVCEVVFDPKKVSYKKLLETYFGIHDPTQLDRQGPDIGSQYRSVIFFNSKEQEKLARKSKEKLEKSGKYRTKIVTEIIPAGKLSQTIGIGNKLGKEGLIKTQPDLIVVGF